MIDVVTERSLWEAVCRQPSDWDRRLVLADFYEENGRLGEAEALRWMVRTQSRAFADTYDGKEEYVWFSYRDKDKGDTDPESDLPRWLFAHLEGGKSDGSSDYRYQRHFPDRLTAEMAVVSAFVRSGRET